MATTTTQVTVSDAGWTMIVSAASMAFIQLFSRGAARLRLQSAAEADPGAGDIEGIVLKRPDEPEYSFLSLETTDEIWARAVSGSVTLTLTKTDAA